MNALVIRAPAKLNLDLRITGKRDDGYHLLDSLVVFADCVDELRFAPAKNLDIDVSGPFADAAGPPDDNLVLRAARAFAAAAGRAPAVAIHLVKNIPVAAGLGGGSSDAAATLRGLNRFWDLQLPDERLHEIAATLGADVPVCLASRPAIMRGIGEVLSPLALPGEPFGLLLANSRVATPTPEVFRKFIFTDAMPRPVRRAPLQTRDDILAMIAENGNDLTQAAIAVAPAIDPVIAALAEAKGALHAGMSGSGATCFALFENRAEAIATHASIVAEHPEWWLHAGVVGNEIFKWSANDARH